MGRETVRNSRPERSSRVRRLHFRSSLPWARSFRNSHCEPTELMSEINDRIRASHSIPFTLMPSLLNNHEMCINQKGIFFPRNHKCRKVAFRESAFGFSVSHTLLSLDLDLAVFHRRSVHGSKIPINWVVSRISVSVYCAEGERWVKKL